MFHWKKNNQLLVYLKFSLVCLFLFFCPFLMRYSLSILFHLRITRIYILSYKDVWTINPNVWGQHLWWTLLNFGPSWWLVSIMTCVFRTVHIRKVWCIIKDSQLIEIHPYSSPIPLPIKWNSKLASKWNSELSHQSETGTHHQCSSPTPIHLSSLSSYKLGTRHHCSSPIMPWLPHIQNSHQSGTQNSHQIINLEITSSPALASSSVLVTSPVNFCYLQSRPKTFSNYTLTPKILSIITLELFKK